MGWDDGIPGFTPVKAHTKKGNLTTCKQKNKFMRQNGGELHMIWSVLPSCSARFSKEHPAISSPRTLQRIDSWCQFLALRAMMTLLMSKAAFNSTLIDKKKKGTEIA